MRGLESKRRVLDDKSDNESIRQNVSQKLGNRTSTLHPENIDTDILLRELEQLRETMQYETYDIDDSVDERSAQAKLDILKRTLFSELEAGKATLYSSIDEKEGADNFELSIQKTIEELREMQNRLADL